MKQIALFLILFLGLFACNSKTENKSNNSGFIYQVADTSDMTNNFYDNTETYVFPLLEVTIDGEIENRGKVDFSDLQVHSVIVKETLLDSLGSDRFIGAYRYDGYSLFDILNNSILKKSNSAEFNPIIDLYVEVENLKGDKVVFSWGELYYPGNLNKIIIANGVSRIVPSKTKELWPLPVESKIVSANDLITERNISSPVKITVKSYPKSFVVNRNISPLYSPEISLFTNSRLITKIDKLPANLHEVTFNTIFYGRGRGIHSTSPFTGILLKDLLIKYYPVTREDLRNTMMCFTGIDGYRCSVSYSELFNRNDQQEFLLVKTAVDEDGGIFRIFPAADFFSDRAIKSVSEIHLGF